MAAAQSKIEKKQNTMISTSLFRMVHEYKSFNMYLSGLASLLHAIKNEENIYVRVYYDDSLGDELTEMLRSTKKIEMVHFENPCGQGLLGALLRYKPLFEKINGVDYVMVLDLDLSTSTYTEYLDYLPDMKKYAFAYSYRKWYRSSRHWYNKMLKDNKLVRPAHLVRGWGMGFTPGLLCGRDTLDKFIEDCQQTYAFTTDKFIKEFKTLNIQAIEMKSYSPKKNFSWAVSDRLQYGVVELFTTFYLLPAVIESDTAIMQIGVQFGILHCLIIDLFEYIPYETKNSLFKSEFGVSFNSFLKAIKEKNCYKRSVHDQTVQNMWSDFIKFARFLIQHRGLTVDAGLWQFIKDNSIITNESNNKVIINVPIEGSKAS